MSESLYSSFTYQTLRAKYGTDSKSIQTFIKRFSDIALNNKETSKVVGKLTGGHEELDAKAVKRALSDSVTDPEAGKQLWNLLSQGSKHINRVVLVDFVRARLGMEYITDRHIVEFMSVAGIDGLEDIDYDDFRKL